MGSVAMVSLLPSVGIWASLSSPSKLGSEGFIDIGLISPFFLAALSSAFFLLRSSCAMALSIFSETIFINRLLAFRSQKAPRVASPVLRIYDHKKKRKKITANMSDRKEKTQTTRVKSMPDKTSATCQSWSAMALSLPKKLMMEFSMLAPPVMESWLL
jgi:hypothetical protein